MSRQRLSLTALLLLLAGPVLAQRFTAAIRGNVTDPSNAVIAGAKVTLKNEETGLSRTATTNAAGNYSFPDLPVGSYQVEVTSPGLKSVVQTGIVINVADVREVNVQLTTGEMTETVWVHAPSRREDKSRFVRNVLGDSEFTTIVQAGTGYPITVAANLAGVNGPGGTGSQQLQTPNRVVGQPCTVSTTNELQWLNPAAFTLDGFPIGTNGSAGRNICNGPGLFQADASLYKNIHLGARVRLQLRFEVFNLFNTVNFLGCSMNTGHSAENVVFDTKVV